MDKKLPKVYANRINKNIKNNKKIAYSSNEEAKEIRTKTNETNITEINKNINQKLNDIFNSSKYVYKAEVEIKLKDKTIVKKIIGKNNDQLITIDNELISISDIIDINFAK